MSTSPSAWREVDASVHLSLTPQQLGNAVESATRLAYSGLLMRHHAALGGVVVAHSGPLKLATPPRFIGASPFAHVRATCKLLVFAPQKGSELLGVVTHIGPDHVGLRVLQVFHAMLPLSGLNEVYRYAVQRWACIGDGADVVIGSQMRFVVEAVKPTHHGLFQIVASLDEGLRVGDVTHALGVLSREHEIDLHGLNTNNVVASPGELRVRRGKRLRTEDAGLVSDVGAFGDALMGTITEASPMREARRGEVAPEVVVAGDRGAEGKELDEGNRKERIVEELQKGMEETGRTKVEPAEESIGTFSPSLEKEKKRITKVGEERALENVGVKGKKKNKRISEAEKAVALTEPRKKKKKSDESKRSISEPRKKKKKKKKRERSETDNGDLGIYIEGMGKLERGKQKQKKKVEVKEEGTKEMFAAAMEAVSIGLGAEMKVEGTDRGEEEEVLVKTQVEEGRDEKKKKKKKRRRESEGDEGNSSRKKKKRRKKEENERLKAALEMDGQRSMGGDGHLQPSNAE